MWARKPERAMQSYSQDLRVRFLRAIATGASARAAGRRFELSLTTAIRWAKAWREGAKLAAHAGFLLGLLEERRDITLHEVAERLVGERGIGAVPSTIWRFYAQRGITFKKDGACRRAAACAGRRATLGLV